MFERVSADDLMSLASRRHPPPLQVGAVLILDVRGGLDISSLRTVLQQRIAAVPRLRQRLEKVPLGCGRPVWVDDSGFNIDDHLRVAKQQSDTDDAGLLDIAANLVTKPLPEDRPLWAATFVPALTGGRAALVLVMHHVVEAGLAGLAVLRGLVDGSPTPPPAAPQPRPSQAALAKDAWRDRIRSLRALPEALGRLHCGLDHAQNASHRTRSTFSHPEVIFFPPWWKELAPATPQLGARSASTFGACPRRLGMCRRSWCTP